MELRHLRTLTALAALPAFGAFHPWSHAIGQSAPRPTKIVANWSSPQLLLRALPHGPTVASLPSIAPDGRILLFTTRGDQGDELLAYEFDAKSGILGESKVFPTEQWKIKGDPRRLYRSNGWGDPVPVFSPDGKKVVESLTTDNEDLEDSRAAAYIFDRDATTGRILYDTDPRTGALSEKHRLITKEDMQQLRLPVASTFAVWRSTSFSPDSRFVYVPMRIFYNVRYPFTYIVQKQLNPVTGNYESPRFILPPGGWDVRSGVGVSSDGTYYLASGYSKDPKDWLYIYPNNMARTPVHLRSYKDDEVIYWVPRDPQTGAPTGPARVVRALRALRGVRNYEHLPPNTYPWFCRAPVAVPNSNVWLFEVELGREYGGEVQLLAATESYFGIEAASGQ